MLLFYWHMTSDKIFYDIKKILKKKEWKEQISGEIYINGTLGTNFWKDGRVIHISLELYADEELLESMEK